MSPLLSWMLVILVMFAAKGVWQTIKDGKRYINARRFSKIKTMARRGFL